MPDTDRIPCPCGKLARLCWHMPVDYFPARDGYHMEAVSRPDDASAWYECYACNRKGPWASTISGALSAWKQMIDKGTHDA